MADLIPFKEIVHLFEDFEHTAWRLETQRGYASDRVSPNWPRFLRGEQFHYDANVWWHANVRAATEQGKRFGRVRLVDDPPTEGQRFLLATGLASVEAGEDIRNLYRSEAQRVGLPEHDFWLFDARIVTEFVIDDAGVTLGVRIHEDAETVLRACQARDVACHYATPTAEFQAQVPSTA